MPMPPRDGSEPGVDLHDWEAVRASVEGDIADDPAAGLSALADLAERVLIANDVALDDAVARQGEDPELVVTYRAARETAEQAEVGAATRSEIETALEDLKTMLDSLAGESPA